MKEETRIKVNQMIEIIEKWDASTISEDNAKIDRVYKEVLKIDNIKRGKATKDKALKSAIYQGELMIKSFEKAGIPTDDLVKNVEMLKKERSELNYKPTTRPKETKKAESKKGTKAVASSTREINV